MSEIPIGLNCYCKGDIPIGFICYCKGELEEKDCCICREIIRHYKNMIKIYNHLDMEVLEPDIKCFSQWFNKHHNLIPRWM